MDYGWFTITLLVYDDVEENKIMTVSQEQKDAVRTLFTKKLKDYISKDKIHFWI